MRTSAFPVWILVVICAAGWLSADLAHARPVLDPEFMKKSQKKIDLNKLDKDSGAQFGEWTVWRHNGGGEAVCLVNERTGLAIYMPWSSNGWINYRTGNGTWYVLFSSGNPELQDRKSLGVEDYIGKRPSFSLAPGKFTIENWNVTVTKEAIEFRGTQMNDVMIIRSTFAECTHNGRTIGGVK